MLLDLLPLLSGTPTPPTLPTPYPGGRLPLFTPARPQLTPDRRTRRLEDELALVLLGAL